MVAISKSHPFLKKVKLPPVLMDREVLILCVKGLKKRIVKESSALRSARQMKSDPVFINKKAHNIIKLELIKEELENLIDEL
jgi:hypothetical protein